MRWRKGRRRVREERKGKGIRGQDDIRWSLLIFCYSHYWVRRHVCIHVTPGENFNCLMSSLIIFLSNCSPISISRLLVFMQSADSYMSLYFCSIQVHHHHHITPGYTESSPDYPYRCAPIPWTYVRWHNAVVSSDRPLYPS